MYLNVLYEAVVPKVDDTTGCYWPFLFEDKLNYECVSIDEMKICSKSPELDENADYHVCDDSSGSNRVRDQIYSEFSKK